MIAWISLALAAPPSVDEPPLSGSRAPDDVAVVIANEGYTGGFGAVAYAIRDADAFAAWLTRTRGVPRTSVTRVTGASRKGIADAVAKAAASVPAGGTLWVYYAGHGLGMQLDGADAPERVLLGINAISQAEELPDYVVPVSQLERIAAGSKAAETVFVIDACFNNAGRDGGSLVSGRFAVPVRDLESHSRVTVWSATGPKQTAVPYEPARHGAFTYFALGALSGWADGVTSAPDGKVTLDEAHVWVQRAMRAAGVGGQSPQLAGSVGMLASSGKLQSEADAAKSSSGPAVDGDVAAQLATQACDQEADTLANEQAVARTATAAAKVTADATVLWEKLVPQLETCESAADRSACVGAVDRFLVTARAAKVDLPESIEAVSTRCGARKRGVTARSVPVPVAEIAAAEGWRERLTGLTNSPTLGPMLRVSAGTFMLGLSRSEVSGANPATQRRTTLTRPFLIMTHEVTQAAYERLMGTNPAVEADDFRPGSVVVGPDLPAVNMTWSDAVTFANRASDADGLPRCYTIAETGVTWDRDCTGYRLPTEAEWERAGRGNTADTFAGTNDPLQVCAFANVMPLEPKKKLRNPDMFTCDDGSFGLAKVGNYRPNAIGLYDMTGNASELTWDIEAPLWVGDVVDPTGPDRPGELTGHVIRGGSYLSLIPRAKLGYRASAGIAWVDTGFRLVRTAP